MCQTADELNTSENTTYFYKYKISKKNTLTMWTWKSVSMTHAYHFSGKPENLTKSENSKVATEKWEKIQKSWKIQGICVVS